MPNRHNSSVIELPRELEIVTTRKFDAPAELVYDVLPAWEGERAVIWDMFKVAVDSGYLPKLPDEAAIYKP